MTRNKKYQLVLCIVLSMILLCACTQEEKWDMHWEQSSGNAFQSMDVSASLPDTQIVRAATTRKKQSTGIKGDYLLKTNWHQHYPFNKALPMINGRRVVAGCVNIALAQIMYYYHYPLQGNGVVHHSWKGQYFTAVLNRRLYWNKMPLTITPDTPNYAIDELAALIRDISMINQTLFGSGPYEQSGAAFDMNQFVFHFGYSREIQQTSSNNPEFFHIIDHEIEARRPVLISIHGQPIDHMAIIDGKTVHNGQTCYHVNMGWGGQHNRFYDLSRPITLESISDQRSIGQTYRFTGHMTLYYPIKPCDKKTCSSNNLEPHDHVSGNQIQGQFDFRTDKDRYENILLKDTTVIQGDRGYANQAFYIEIYDQFHQLLSSSAPDSKAIQHDFDPGIYHFTVSLCQSNQQSMHCYELKPGYAQYTIRISTGVITPDEKLSIANDIGPPIITNESTDIILPRNFTKHIIRMDAFHPMGLPVALSVASDTKSPGIDAYMNDHFLIITNQHQGHLKSTKLSVTAHTNGIRTQADFNIMFSGQRVWFGKTIDIPGEFKNQESQNIHRLILEDRCRLTGYNGFMNQAFYMQIMDKQGKRIVGPNDREIDRYFDRGIYHIQTSLKIERRQQTQGSQKISTRYYEYQKGLGDQYVIHAYCPDVNYDLDLLAQDNTDSPPQFQKNFHHSF
ncbi:MAG: hypothetical protein OMM_01239 [Candidatus Magnetoglobus multicellularis str. Araruama]|uniref:Uncharacterized protein n=1 Tax=Candidatus Magnetoglobus multicellularis str. Araruama TaxID=890399 RepID=A0A1V1PE26_9BACT|nr:MAG: hypothetical protein OMM_01239 [Candidatus Magnetoglobus multicellularis str. Araruama]